MGKQTAGVRADQLCYARQREWRGWFWINRLKLRDLITADIIAYHEDHPPICPTDGCGRQAIYCAACRALGGEGD